MKYDYNPEQIRHFYTTVVEKYAEKFSEELSYKHLDQILLREFARTCEGKIADFACGPGQASRFLKDCGVNDITGVDITPAMIRNARRLHPDVTFEEGDMLHLNYSDGFFNHAICFYGIVHFDMPKVRKALKEIARVLKPDGQFLFSFHVGDEVIHFDEILDMKVDIDFKLQPKEHVIDACSKAGFEIIDVLERQAYTEVEHPTRRAYVWVKKK